MWSVLWQLCEWVIWRLWPPVVVEVSAYSVHELRNKPGDILVVISPHPRRYSAKLTLTNRSGRTAYVKSIKLTRHPGGICKEAPLRDPIRLEPHEPKPEAVIFPIDENEEPIPAGEFRIEVTPSVGKAASVRVRL